MKRSCKHIDITDPETIKPFVRDCVYRHWKRSDFKKLFLDHGLSRKQYDEIRESKNKYELEPIIDNIAKDAVKRISDRELNLPPISITERRDRATGKLRQIGKQSAMQQIFDYIAVYSCMDIFKRRIVPQQVSSIKGRGQVYGVKMIQKHIIADNRAERYAKTHNLRYDKKCKYFVKLDIKGCYAAARVNIFIKLLKRDCANDDIIWLWHSLLITHCVGEYHGFIIGALTSQWACQYLISFLYRYAASLHKFRRAKSLKLISHIVIFMDDILLFGSDRRSLKFAVKSLMTFSKNFASWAIKPNWSIRRLAEVPVDMMGYTVDKKGKIALRGRNYIHSRRIRIRFERKGYIALTSSKRILSYKGFYKYSDCRTASSLFQPCFKIASKVVSNHDRRNNYGTGKSIFWRPRAANYRLQEAI